MLRMKRKKTTQPFADVLARNLTEELPVKKRKYLLLNCLAARALMGVLGLFVQAHDPKNSEILQHGRLVTGHRSSSTVRPPYVRTDYRSP